MARRGAAGARRQAPPWRGQRCVSTPGPRSATPGGSCWDRWVGWGGWVVGSVRFGCVGGWPQECDGQGQLPGQVGMWVRVEKLGKGLFAFLGCVGVS